MKLSKKEKKLQNLNIVELETLARNEDLQAVEELACRYYNFCNDHHKNENDEYGKKAIYYFEKCLHTASPYSIAKYANLLWFGIGTKADYKQAFEYYLKSADLNCGLALNNLGACYMNGEFVEKDFNKAEEYFNLAIKQNYIDAKNNLLRLVVAKNLSVFDNYENMTETQKIKAKNKILKDFKNFNDIQKTRFAYQYINPLLKKNVVDDIQFEIIYKTFFDIFNIYDNLYDNKIYLSFKFDLIEQFAELLNKKIKEHFENEKNKKDFLTTLKQKDFKLLIDFLLHKYYYATRNARFCLKSAHAAVVLGCVYNLIQDSKKEKEILLVCLKQLMNEAKVSEKYYEIFKQANSMLQKYPYSSAELYFVYKWTEPQDPRV